MGSARRDEDGRTPAQNPADRTRLDRRAEALRANLKRRKAQTRARDEARQDEALTLPEPGDPGRDG